MTRLWRKRSKRAQFVAVQDVMETATTKIADVVFPAQAFTEREGTYTSGERRVQRFYVAVPVTGEAKTDFAITARIAEQMGLALEGDLGCSEYLISWLRLFRPMPVWITQRFPKSGRSGPLSGAATCSMAAPPTRTRAGWVRSSQPPRHAAKRSACRRSTREAARAVPGKMSCWLFPVNQAVRPRHHRHEVCGPPARAGSADRAISLHPDAAEKMGIEEGQLVNLSFDGASGEVVVKLDPTIPVGVALVPRDMGLAIREPVPATVSVPAKVK